MSKMSKMITLHLPDGYEETTHIVVVTKNERRSGVSTRPSSTYSTYVLAVKDDATVEIEEIGEGPLTEIMVEAARVIRAGTTK